MANKFRYVSGDVEPILVSKNDVNATIGIGDIVGYDSPGLIVIPEDFGSFGLTFTGVASQQSQAGDNDPIRVSVKGTYRHPCVVDTYRIGDRLTVGPNGTLKKTTAAAEVIGRVSKEYPQATNEIEWRIASQTMAGT